MQDLSMQDLSMQDLSTQDLSTQDLSTQRSGATEAHHGLARYRTLILASLLDYFWVAAASCLQPAAFRTESSALPIVF
jgi:hypothetical protein